MSSPNPSEDARRNPEPPLRSLGLVLWVTFALCGAMAASADNLLTSSTLTRDGSLGSGPLVIPGTGGVFDIGESHGSRPGGSSGINLLHSFGVFELASGDTANFHADYPTENIVIRVPDSVTIFEGSVDTKTGANTNAANLYWLSPQGVIFGDDATLNVGGSLAVSTSDSLAFDADGETQNFEAQAGGQVPTLATARPEAFGFLGDASQRIVLNGSVLCGGNDVGCGVSASSRRAVAGSITLEAGGIDLLEGATIYSTNQDIDLVATDSISLSGTDPADSRGSAIRINNRNTSAGGNITIAADQIRLTDGAAVFSLNQVGVESGGNIHMSAASGIRLHGSSQANSPIGSLILQNNFNDLVQIFARLQFGSADILTVGSAVDANGSTGAITLDAPVIKLQDGAEVTTFAYGQASGDITLRASERLELSGRGGEASTGGEPASASAIQSRNPGFGLAGARAGDILVTAGDILLGDGAVLAVDTAGQGHAGKIQIEADRLALLGGSSLRSSSTGTVASLGAAPGNAGRIDVDADRVRLSGASTISVFAAEGPEVPSNLGPGEPSAHLSEGNITVVAEEWMLLEDGSTVEASVDTGLGGSIQIGTPEEPTTALVLRDGSAILAKATGGTGGDGGTDTPPNENDDGGGGGANRAARGGDISIHAEAVLACPDCDISADGPTEGTGGSVVINNPETALDSQARPPAIHYLDAASLLLAQCGAEQTGAEGAGRLAVARWPGRSFSPEAPLLALAPMGSPLSGTRAANDWPGASPNEAADLAGGGPAPETLALALHNAGETLRGGRAGRAASAFESVQQKAAASGNAAAQADALRGLAESQQAAGAFADSLAPLAEALALAEASGDAARQAAALGALANAQVAQGQFSAAEASLTQALALVETSPEDAPAADTTRGLAAALLNNLGSERALAGHPKAAFEAYRRSARLARESSNTRALAQAEANAARAALQMTDTAAAQAALESAHAALGEAANKNTITAAEAAELRIHLARSEVELARQAPDQRRAALLRAHQDLSEASQSAEASGDARAASYALGSLGELYAAEGGRDAEALFLTRRALKAAENARAADLLARWNAQAGQLAWRTGASADALDAYRRAVRLLAETRPEAGAARGQADVAFRQAVEPVYLELVDLLLRASAKTDKKEKEEALLVEARQVVEDWKAAELRNYFRDGCAAELQATTRSIEDIDPRAAVIYPILLPGRLELLVGRAGGIARYSVPVSRAQVEAEARRLQALLTKRTTHEYRRPARQLYQWLVAPFEKELAAAGIDTLVFVPGGALRTVPMAALHDGQGFLLERYAVATTPSMNLLAPKPMEVGERSLLLAGLSEAVQGYPALPGVPAELGAIQQRYGGEVLLDAAFERSALERALLEDRPGLVHIASHAEFSGDPDTSFVLTHSDRLSIDQLAQLIRAGRYGEEPVELLMLSACETAAGNERAALGLAGVAIRAGARSAMGSLWSVSDEATSALVTEFYAALDQPGISKARALQSAQTALLTDSRYAHPFYWAPFLVINNWL